MKLVSMASYKKLSTLDIESSVDENVSLTWQNLCVSVYDRTSGQNKVILKDVTGYVCPGHVLAIMGPSGGGKSTLLDALAGRLDLSTKQSGEILINGCRQALPHGTLAYVTQDIVLMATLTVRETMYYSSELLLPSSMSKIEKHKKADDYIKEMGLQGAIDTRVGCWGVKGLSGGQKRRLSLCIEMLNHSNKLLFLDEPTTGLDSAASLNVLSKILSKERKFGRTIIVSVHQPSSQLFGLFDNLCLLSAGRMVYFGPLREANEFFTSNGFPCPSLQSPSDHFLQIINKDFDEEIDMQEISTSTKQMCEIITHLVNSYNSSSNHQEVKSMINSICKQKKQWIDIENRRASFLKQCEVLTRRSFVNMSRDWGYYWIRFIVYVALAFGIGHLFFALDKTLVTYYARVTVIMYVISILSLLAVGGYQSITEEMKVFKIERLNGYYSSASFIIGHTLSSLPFLLLTSIIPGSITYYLPQLQNGLSSFVYFILVLLACLFWIESVMIILASLLPNFLMGATIAGGIPGLMLISVGFLRLPNELPLFLWRYPMYYISFHRYAYQGLLKNEFEDSNYPINIGTSTNMISGNSILRTLLQVDTKFSKWIYLIILFGMVIIYNLFFIFINTTFDKLKPLIRARLGRRNKNASGSCYAKRNI